MGKSLYLFNFYVSFFTGLRVLTEEINSSQGSSCVKTMEIGSKVKAGQDSKEREYFIPDFFQMLTSINRLNDSTQKPVGQNIFVDL